MQREFLYFIVLVVFGLLLRPALSQLFDGSDGNGSNASDVFVVIDYDSSGSGATTSVLTPASSVSSATVAAPTPSSGSGVEPTSVLTPASSVSSATVAAPTRGSGSGSGMDSVLTPASSVSVAAPTPSSGSDMEPTSVLTPASSVSSAVVAAPTPSPSPPPPSCMLPEDRVSPSTVNGTEQNLRRRAYCHAACVAQQIARNPLPRTDRRDLAGYPVWNVIPDSVLLPRGRLDCGTFSYTRIAECERGCLVDPLDAQCTTTCRGECFVECGNCDARLTQCSCGFRLPTLPCGLDCRLGRCTTGCGIRNDLNQLVYPPRANPDAPPMLSQDDVLPTQFCVNVRPPTGTDLVDLVATLLVRVEDIVPGNYSYFWIRQLKLDLQAFVNREVNVSYAVATTRGISEYSPATTVQVTAGDGSPSFPEQLSGFNVSAVEPDERPGFFQHHTIELSWERPANYELITSYTVILVTGTRECGSQTGTVFTAEPNATGLIMQASDPTSPPVSFCSYRITVLVNPMRPGDMPAGLDNLVVPRYPIPGEIESDCQSSFSRVNRTYMINFTWSAPFSAAVLSAVNNFRVTRMVLDQGRPVVTISFPDYRILPSENFSVVIEADPLVGTEANYRYEINVRVFFNTTLRPPIEFSDNCLVDPVPAPPPDRITNLTVTGDFSEVYRVQTRIVNGDVNFTWTEPFVPFGRLLNYDVWFDRSALSLSDNRDSPWPSITAPANSSRLLATFQTTDTSFIAYLQLRPRNEYTIVGDWSTPLPINVSIFEPPAPDVMTDIRVNDISYELPGGPQVRVTGGMLWTAPNTTFGDLTQYHLWIGDTPLGPDDVEVNGVRIFQVNRTSFSINQDFPLLNGSADVFIQMRAVSQFNRRGNWSGAFPIRIRLPPPPRNITATISGVPTVNEIADGMTRVSGEVVFEWSLPDDPSEGGVTRYESRVGLEALDQYENPLMSELNSFEVMGGTGVDPFFVDVETENADNLTVVVQMRSSGNGLSVSGRKRRQVSMGSGPWSDPMILPVVIPPPLPVSRLPAILGSTLSVAAIILIALLALLIVLVVICVKSWLFKRRLEKVKEPDNLLMFGRSRMPTYIPLAKIEGKEPLLDYWEVPAADVIVEDRLGEGAFGEVFKGTIKGPLRNPKISSVLKHTIGVPIAIKLLKTTASGKEKADFLSEIDMMKKIAEGYNPHIVNMVGCVTLQEPLCLITEFVPYGDLLSFLRSNRKKAARMRRRQKIIQAQVEEQLQLEHVIIEQAQLRQPDVQQTEVEETQMEQVVLEQAQVEQAQPVQEDAAAPSTSPAPYLEARNEYSHLITQQYEVEVAQQSEPTRDDTPAPYLEAKNEYSRLDPRKADFPEEEEEEDAYPDLGDLEANDLIQFAYQIATGMEYLASLNIIHRDLACRNILLGEDKKLKITDFGMSREVEEVYVKKTKGRLPLKWMAVESIISREFTTASDVWAYGVALWEIGTLGGFPYPTIPNQDLLMMLGQGYRLEKPDNCAPEVYEIMLECWNEDPQDRPTFSQLRTKFGSLILAGKDDLYIDLEVDEMKPYYLIKEEEEKKEGGSSSSSGSEASIASVEQIKGKKREREELTAKPSNPYVEAPVQPTASIRRPPELIMEEERDVEEQTELEESPYADQLPSRPLPRPGNQAAPPVAERPAQNAAINGVPISMLHSDQTSTPESEPMTVNPYVDDPSTRQSLTASTPTVETNGSFLAGRQSNGPAAVVTTNL